jgi:nicotinamide phosphoribosyltransferase
MSKFIKVNGESIKTEEVTNSVLGVGSDTHQLVTRDTHSFSMKATSVVVNGERREIFKDPITDDGIKKSAKGLVKVELIEDEYILKMED